MLKTSLPGTHTLLGSILALPLLLSLSLGACSEPLSGPVTGAYSGTHIGDANVIKAANFAINARNSKTDNKYRLQAILQAQTQVVAGLNFKLCLKTGQADPTQSVIVQATVYQNLSQEMALSKWEVVPSCPKTEK